MKKRKHETVGKTIKRIKRLYKWAESLPGDDPDKPFILMRLDALVDQLEAFIDERTKDD